MTIVVSGKIRVAASSRDKGIELVAPLVAATRAEAGCMTYGFYEDVLEPCTLRIYEEWESNEALDAHMKTDHMAAFLAGMGSLEILEMDVKFYRAEQFERGIG